MCCPLLSLWLSHCDVVSAVQRIVGQNIQKQMLVSQQDCSQRALHEAPAQGHQEPSALLHRSSANPDKPARKAVVPHKYEYYSINQLEKQTVKHLFKNCAAMNYLPWKSELVYIVGS